MKTLIITILLFVFMGNAYSQTSIEGKVRDSSTFEPILFAGVVLYKNGVLVMGAETDLDGNFLIANIQPGKYDLEIGFLGYKKTRIEGIQCLAGQVKRLEIKLVVSGDLLNEVSIIEYKVPLIEIDNTTVGTIITSDKISKLHQKDFNTIKANAAGVNSNNEISIRGSRSNETVTFIDGIRIPGNKVEKENNYLLVENHFKSTEEENTTTMSIDVDRAAYSNIRSHLNRGDLPNPNDVRIEEMINYFSYDWKLSDESNKHPFGFFYELNTCPWNKEHQVLSVVLKGKYINKENTKPSNLVFLIDVSGSMDNPLKLPLLKKSFNILVDQLREDDKISIVVYAGAAGTIIDGVSGDQKYELKRAIEKLQAGGSTAGEQGIKQAYNLARKHFKENGNNRIILATDGDFNVGISNDEDLIKLIEKERESKVFLSILGFGTGNYQDNKMQKLADSGNGNHFYIDNLEEANKTLINEFTSTIYTIAKDVKVQLAFNKKMIKEYKVVGYENRQLANEDFDNDKKDAGEMGAGHIVTIIYELIPTGKFKENSKSDIATLKFRYKNENSNKSIKGEIIIPSKIFDNNNTKFDTQWALAVAEFGLLLRNSSYKGTSTYENLLTRLDSMKEIYNDNFKLECVTLIKTAKQLSYNF